ncbi:MAG: type I-E CRISPR-associated protein Cas5/CasD [Nitratireductor sp.]
MTAFVIVQLGAPLAAFGDAAGNVERKTLDRPTRSALLGLAGAALGVRRDDADANAALGASLSTASRTLDPGRLLRDFHTYESVLRARERYFTRADALARGTRNTSITRRDYRTGGLWLGAYALRNDASLALAALREAFLKPAFTLYLGRKACSLSLPLAPGIVDADDIAQAFSVYASAGGLPESGLIATDDRSLLPAAGNRLVQRSTLRVDPRDRRSWQVGARSEYLLGADTRETGP